MHPPGSEVNPLVFFDDSFADVRIALDGGYKVHFKQCTFTRAPFLGPLPSHEACNVKNADTPVGDTVMFPAGSAENPVIFHRQVFAHLRIDFGEIHATFVECTFICCELNGFENATITRPAFSWHEHEAFQKRPYTFYCMAGEHPVFGTVVTEEDTDYVGPRSANEIIEEYVNSARDQTIATYLKDNPPPQPSLLTRLASRLTRVLR